MFKTQKRKCSICKKPFEGFGHNPEPVLPYEQRCCGVCNDTVVVPIRIAGIAMREFKTLAKGGTK